jgi:hypothetical protein
MAYAVLLLQTRSTMAYTGRTRMHHLVGDDPFLAWVRYAPILFVVAGLLVVAWLSRQRSAHEIQPDVLAALSETEPLPAATIRQRPPLDHQNIDRATLVRALEDLCGAGLVVRWYETREATGSGPGEAVYRRVILTRAPDPAG